MIIDYPPNYGEKLAKGEPRDVGALAGQIADGLDVLGHVGVVQLVQLQPEQPVADATGNVVEGLLEKREREGNKGRVGSDNVERKRNNTE